MIVDPFNPNYAIGSDGSPLFALRIGEVKDPAAPTLKEITVGQIIGYTPGPFCPSKLTEES